MQGELKMKEQPCELNKSIVRVFEVFGPDVPDTSLLAMQFRIHEATGIKLSEEDIRRFHTAYFAKRSTGNN